MFKPLKLTILNFLCLVLWFGSTLAVAQVDSWPFLASIDFEDNLDAWELSDDGWKLGKNEGVNVLSQFRKESSFQPPVRSPYHRAILKEPIVTDFQLDVKVLATHPAYNHRDVCLFFGYQNEAQFYYVHLGEKTDPHCNQIFIVNNAPRTKISRTTNSGTPWDDQWHHVRIRRVVSTGEISVYFDDMEKPVMTAIDDTFQFGRVGLGSFDDTADWAEFRLRGVKKKSKEDSTPAGDNL